MNDVETALRAAGKRVTRQRKLIFDVINDSGDHLDAYQIYHLARKKDARLSLGTVYRALGLLGDLGLVRELRLGEKRSFYELSNSAEHHHLICLRCGKVIEFQRPDCERLQEDLANAYGFEIMGSRIQFKGYCSQCRRELGHPKPAPVEHQSGVSK